MTAFVDFARNVADASLQAAALIIAVCLLRLVLGRRLTPAWRRALWVLVGLRLLMVVPMGIDNRWNVQSGLQQLAGMILPPASPEPNVNASGTRVSIESGTYAGSVGIESLAPAASVVDRLSRHEGHSPVVVSLATIWLAGVAIFTVRLVVNTYRLRRHIAGMTPVDDPRILRMAARAAATMGMRRAVRLVTSDRFRSPAVCGAWRPTLVLPPADSALVRSDADLRLALLHEFAHLRDNDPQLAVVMGLIGAIHWFNPLAWLAARAARDDAELACDAAVLRTTGADEADAYGHCLLRIAAHVAHLEPHAAAIGAASSLRKLRRRIVMISTYDTSRRSLLSRVCGAAAFVLIGAAAITCAPTAAGRQATPDARTSDDTSNSLTADDLSPVLKTLLAKRIGRFDVDNVPLSEVTARLSKETGAEITFDKAVLGDAGVDLSTPIFTRMGNVTLAQAIDIVCDQVRVTRLAYRASGDVIVITTAEDLARRSVVTRTYDIRDLLVIAPEMEEPPVFGAFPALTKDGHAANRTNAGPDAAADASPTRQDLIEQITQLIVDTIASDTWKLNGGVIGQISELGGQLVITQTAANQTAIRQLLEQLRLNRAVQVNVTARFLTIDADKLPPRLVKLLAATSAPASGTTSTRGAFIPADEVEPLLQELNATPSATTLTAPRITLFNGQRGYVKVSTDRAYIATYTMTRTPDGGRRFEPKVETIPDGVIFDVEATTSADRNYITLALHPQLAKLVRMESEPFAGDPEEKSLRVQRPIIETQELRTTISIPHGGTCVLTSGQHGAESKQVLLLLVTPMVITHEKP